MTFARNTRPRSGISMSVEMSLPAGEPAARGRVGLLAAAVGGDREALTQIVLRYEADMARLSYFIAGDTEVAREAVQRAWQRAVTRLGSVSDERRLGAWLLTIAANETRQVMRRDRRRARSEQPIDEATAAEPDDAALIDRVDLVRVLVQLTEADRELLGLRYVLGLTSEEIGEQIHASPGAVRTRLSRLLHRLRGELA